MTDTEIQAYARGFAAAIVGAGVPERWCEILADATAEAGIPEVDWMRLCASVEKLLTSRGIYVP